MGRIIAVANQKGGVGKSTTAINLSACLAEKGKKVLAIDMDPQGNTTSGFGVDKNGIENTLYELLLGEAETKDTIVKDVVENLDLIPSNINLSGAEIELVGIDDKEFILKGITDKLRRKYDYIILDCPPSLNMLTINALTAATSVLVPIQCEYYALEGLSQLIHTIDLVKERLKISSKLSGVPNSAACTGTVAVISATVRNTLARRFPLLCLFLYIFTSILQKRPNIKYAGRSLCIPNHSKTSSDCPAFDQNRHNLLICK